MRSFTAHAPSAATVRRLRGAIFALAAFVLVTGCEPLWVLPGGALGGTETRVPEDWGFSDAVDTVQIETGLPDSYSVNVWGVSIGPHFYVAAAQGGDSPWARNMVEIPAVRLRIDDAVYPLRAARVEGADELATVIAAYVRKYAVEESENFVSTAWVFRLYARES